MTLIQKYIFKETYSEEEFQEDQRLEINVKMQVTVAQALALKAFFDCWTSLGSMGCSREVSFFVDGDGNFKPNCEISFSKEIKELSLPEEQLKDILSKAQVSKEGEEPICFDYDSIATQLRLLKETYSKEELDDFQPIDRTVENEFNIPEGYYLGLQSGYIVTIPGIVEFKAKFGVRGKNCRIYCIVTKDIIKVESQKYDDSIDAYRPYDWEKKEYLSTDDFVNTQEPVNEPANQT